MWARRSQLKLCADERGGTAAIAVPRAASTRILRVMTRAGRRIGFSHPIWANSTRVSPDLTGERAVKIMAVSKVEPGVSSPDARPLTRGGPPDGRNRPVPREGHVDTHHERDPYAAAGSRRRGPRPRADDPRVPDREDPPHHGEH